MTWAEVKASWSASWRRLEKKAIDDYGSAVQANPEAFRDAVVSFANELAQARRHLDALRTRLAKGRGDARLREAMTAWERRYADLAAGLMADAQPAPVVGAVPVVLVVLGIVIGLAAIAWAAAAWEYAVNLREQTALADRELTARMEASREGKPLPPSTLAPPPPDTGGSSIGPGWVLAGGAALVLGAVVVPTLWRR
jgi:hypothetical protein